MMTMETTSTGLPAQAGKISEAADEEREPTFLEWFEDLAGADARASASLTKEIYPNRELMSVAMDMPAPRANARTKPSGSA